MLTAGMLVILIYIGAAGCLALLGLYFKESLPVWYQTYGFWNVAAVGVAAMVVVAAVTNGIEAMLERRKRERQ